MRSLVALALALLLAAPASAQAPWDREGTAQVVMWTGQAADFATTAAWASTSKELGFWRNERGGPHLGKIAVAKGVLIGSTYLLPKRWRGKPFRSRVQFGIGAIGWGAAGFNVAVRF